MIRSPAAPPSERFASKTFCFKSTAEIKFAAPEVTKTFELSGNIANCSGCAATGTTAKEASDVASRIEIEESSRLETTTILPDGATRAIHGRRPALPRAPICRVAQSMETIAFDPEAGP